MTPDEHAVLFETKNAAVNTETIVRLIQAAVDRMEIQVGQIHQAVFNEASKGEGNWDGLDKKAGDTLALVKDINEAVAALVPGEGGGTVVIDTAAIAKAVNDDAAARLQA